jgi:hypothetical protein
MGNLWFRRRDGKPEDCQRTFADSRSGLFKSIKVVHGFDATTKLIVGKAKKRAACA